MIYSNILFCTFFLITSASVTIMLSQHGHAYSRSTNHPSHHPVLLLMLQSSLTVIWKPVVTAAWASTSILPVELVRLWRCPVSRAWVRNPSLWLVTVCYDVIDACVCVCVCVRARAWVSFLSLHFWLFSINSIQSSRLPPPPQKKIKKNLAKSYVIKRDIAHDKIVRPCLKMNGSTSRSFNILCLLRNFLECLRQVQRSISSVENS